MKGVLDMADAFVAFTCGDKEMFHHMVPMAVVPKLGDQVQIDDYEYRVKDMTFVILDGRFDHVVVDIEEQGEG